MRREGTGRHQVGGEREQKTSGGGERREREREREGGREGGREREREKQP